MRTIMLATDGSPSAAAATTEALDLARQLELPLAVVSVAQDKVPMYGYYGYAEIVDDLRKLEDERIGQVLADVASQAELSGLECTTTVLHGPAGEEICRHAREHEARVLVIGAHRWNSVGRLIHGSVSTYVLHHAATPVLVVHGEENGAAEEDIAETEASR